MILYSKIYNRDDKQVAIAATDLTAVRMKVLEARFKRTASLLTPKTTDGLISLSYDHTWTDIINCGELSPEIIEWIHNADTHWLVSADYPTSASPRDSGVPCINCIKLYMDYYLSFSGIAHTINDRITEYSSKIIRFRDIKHLIQHE